MRHFICLLLLTFTVGFTLLQYGGTTAPEWNLTLAAVCITALVMWVPGRASSIAPPLSPLAALLAAWVVAYVALQCVPLPAGWLAIISPARFEILQAWNLQRQNRGALSVSPIITFAHLLRLLAYILVFLISRELAFRNAVRPWLTAVPLLAMGVAEAAIGMIQHFETGGYATGTYIHHGHLAGLLEMVLPLALTLIAISLEQERDGLPFAVALRVSLLAACAAAILVCLVYTGSRMSLVAAVVSLTVMAAMELFLRRRRSTVGLATALACLGLLAISAPISLLGRYENGLTAEARIQIWKDTFELIHSYSVFGCGLGTFVSAVPRYLSFTPGGLVDYAHNDYLQLLSELGVAGFLPLTALAAVFFRDCARCIRRESNRPIRLLTAACVASLAAIAVHSIGDFQFYIPGNAMVAAWIAGIAGGIAAKQSQSPTNARVIDLRAKATAQ